MGSANRDGSVSVADLIAAGAFTVDSNERLTSGGFSGGLVTPFTLDQLVERDSQEVLFERDIGDVTAASLSAAASYRLSTAMYPGKLLSCTVTLHGAAVAASGTNFYTFVLRKYRGTASVDIATKTTATDGITQRRGYRFDQLDFETNSNNILLKDEVLAVVVSKTGTPATDLLGFAVSGRLARLS